MKVGGGKLETIRQHSTNIKSEKQMRNVYFGSIDSTNYSFKELKIAINLMIS